MAGSWDDTGGVDFVESADVAEAAGGVEAVDVKENGLDASKEGVGDATGHNFESGADILGSKVREELDSGFFSSSGSVFFSFSSSIISLISMDEAFEAISNF